MAVFEAIMQSFRHYLRLVGEGRRRRRLGEVDVSDDPLSEGRDAPLYHATWAVNALFALRDDTLRDRTLHPARAGTPAVSGVSLTRSRRFAETWGEVVFVLDQAALSRRYRIMPHDYWGLSREPVIVGVGRRQGTYAEAEEFVPGPISPLSRYLRAIFMAGKVEQRLIAQRALGQDYADLLDHPLLHTVG